MATTRFSFYPEVGEQRYCDIADQVSVLAMHVFCLMRGKRYLAPFTYDDKPFSFAEIERLTRDAGHDPSEAKLWQCLSELERARALVVEERPATRANNSDGLLATR